MGVTITPATISANGNNATFTMPGNAVTITATFSDIPPTLYAISVTPTGAEAGEEVTASVTEAMEGTTITLTATLNAGRQVALSAAEVTISPSTISTSGDIATFTMPGNAVTVSATFSSISAGYAQPHAVNGETFDTHYVPSGGTFIMGQHVQTTTQTVTLTKNFWMGEIEVTQSLWEAVWGTAWPGSPTYVPSSTYGLGANKPAYYVTWFDTVAFCNLITVADSSIANSEQVYYSNDTLTAAYTKENAAASATVYVDWSKKGYRLPTEAEWEYAARYIDGTNWNHGNHTSGDTEYACYDAASCSHTLATNERIGDYAWYSGNNGPSSDPTYGTKDVRQKTANALGLRDMSGNVWEWCYDWYAGYSSTPKTDPTGPTDGSNRVRRGATWANQKEHLRCSYRSSYAPMGISTAMGFRLCRTAD